MVLIGPEPLYNRVRKEAYMEAVTAIVQDVVRRGRHGPYAVATSDKIGGSITFSLDSNVWQEQAVPEPGTHVYLTDLRKKRAGWRALSGRFTRPSDEHQQPSKEH